MSRSPLTSISICLLICLYGQHARGAFKQFIPRYVDYSANTGIVSLYESDTSSSRANTNKRSEWTMQESLSLEGLGFLYSPLFISMQTTVSFGLQQDTIKRNGDKFSTSGDANQFKHVFKVFPSHPYNMEFYGLRKRPMQSGSWGGNSSIINEYGAKAIYDFRPWNVTLMYVDQKTNRIDSTSERNYLNFYSTYYDTIAGFSATTAYHHSEHYNNSIAGYRDTYDFGINKKFDSWTFSSGFNRERQTLWATYEDIKSSSSTESQGFSNQLSTTLPLNFSALLSYSVTENDSLREVDSGEFGTFTDSERYRFRLSHKLYKSLATSFGYGHNYNETSGGRTSMENYQLNTNYSKMIPWGNFSASAWTLQSSLDNKGAPKTLFENHSISTIPSLSNPAFTFTLNYPLIDSNSIVIKILDINNNETAIVLSENLNHYTVTEIAGDLFRIEILPAALTVPGLSGPINFREDYQYQADYSFLPSDYELQTSSWGTTVQLSLFNSLLTPMYSYSNSSQEVKDGEYPGIPDKSESHALSLTTKYKSLKGEINQIWTKSKSNSTKRFTANVDYSSKLSHSTSGFLSLGYEDKTIKDLRATGPNSRQDDSLYSVQAQLQTLWPEKNLTGAITANYSLFEGTGKSNNLSFLTILTWHVGQLNVDLSATYNESESEFGQNSSEQNNTVVRFILRRELF